jgi:hypothetical protein
VYLPYIDRVLVLHDFDYSGFSIFGTLGKDGRRYVYRNEAAFVDLGLRLADVERLGLQSEPVEIKGDRDARSDTLERHGASQEEIDFLVGDEPKRVELNAMTSRQFIDFLEAKLIAHGVRKVIPDEQTIERHARRLIEKRLAKDMLDEMRKTLAERAAEKPLPADIRQTVANMLAEDPALSWDQALAVLLL